MDAGALFFLVRFFVVFFVDVWEPRGGAVGA